MRLIDAAFLLLLLLACHLGKLNSTEVASEAEGSVGCLFNKSLCKANSEWCFNDYVFGRCVSYVDADDSDFHRYRLNRESLRVLKSELDKLLKRGYGWRRRYTQCVVKTVLFAIRYQIDYNEEACNSYADHEPFPSYYEGNPETMDPKSVGQVQFTPSVINPHAEFADEIYIPISEKDVFQEAVFPLKGINTHAEDDYSNDLRRTFLLNEINKYKRGRGNRGDEAVFEIYQRNNDDDGHDDDDDDGDDDEGENGELPSNYFAYLNEIPERNEVSDNLREADDILEAFRFDRPSNFPNHYGTHEESMLENLFTNDRNILKSFSRNYNTPEKFRNGHETKDEVIYPKANLFTRPNQPLEVFYYPEDRELIYDTYNEKNVDRNEDNDGGVFTEGGVVYLKDDKKSDEPNSLDELVSTYSNWGFKRPERLDVKKPGPSLSNVFKTQKENPTTNKESKTEKGKEASDSLPKTTQIKSILSQPEKKKGGSPMESPSLRRQTTTVQPAKEKDSNNIDNSEFAYVKLKNRVNTWQEGARIVRKVEEILNLRQNTFTNIRVDQNDVRFKVESNRLGLNASEIARRIEVLKGPIQSNTGIEIVSTGVGNQNNLPPSMSLLGEDERQLWILSFLLCGIIAAIAIIGTVFFIIKRHPHARDKLANLTQMDSEASKDYQDLCRARMASKTSQEKPEGNVGGHRVTNLAKENEATNHSPSSRSSTSSWSEEPALTNMDISTGHMVLSYMEDHLKNKDRLEQEWIALCAYEAEPCATTIALKGDNEKKNRYNDVLPYDHARVVLNELSNITGSDYINASTITDHDPRNPAYIASQGPLEQTTADFWQMIWEQGSVVMVMLTRLNENGATICHRYWPEEGSELYHIYEVHLVSEHIWCDDYLVRSFYLKNLKTSETRTVTQFHFLSWPENGVPLSTKALLEFRRKVNKSYRGRSCPVVVHCSDGVGRTGTYCLIDMVLNRMAKGAKEIDIAATLEHIRDQRPLMVRTKQQFEFVLMAVAEEVHAILKALPATLNHSPPPVVKEKE